MLPSYILNEVLNKIVIQITIYSSLEPRGILRRLRFQASRHTRPTKRAEYGQTISALFPSKIESVTFPEKFSNLGNPSFQ